MMRDDGEEEQEEGEEEGGMSERVSKRAS